MNLLSAWVVLAPGGHELGEVVGPEDGGVPGQVVEAKHQGQGSDKPSLRTSCSCCTAQPITGFAIILGFLIIIEK
jgi:hypothetical protein